MGFTLLPAAGLVGDAPASGLTLATPTSIANSSGTSSAVGGKVIFDSVVSISLNGCFTAAYENYLVMLQLQVSTTLNVDMRMRASGTDYSTANYARQYLAADGGTPVSGRNTTQTVYAVGTTSDRIWCNLSVYEPMLAVSTRFWHTSSSGETSPVVVMTSGALNTTSAYDGFTLIASTGIMTGTIRVFSYENS